MNYLEDPINGSRKWATADSLRIQGVSSETYKIIKEGMFRVVQGQLGTAHAAHYGDINVAGKTGTAQNPHGEDHAWFIGFAPFENPKIAMCILLENGGSGGRVAAPIAREIIKTYFNPSKKRDAEI
jgi:peptidoglycan glycosyltransferase